MVWGKRRGRKLGGRKRVNRRRVGMRRSRLGRVRQPVQYFKRTSWRTAEIAAPMGTATAFKLEPQLNLVPNYTEFTALYDQYQIKGVKVTFYPKFSEVMGVANQDAGGGLTGFGPINLMGQVASVLDYDGNGPTTMAGCVEYQNLRITRGNALHSRYFKPAVATAMFKNLTALTTAYGEKKNVWIDTNNPDVTHYGMYGVVDLTNLSPAFLNTNVLYDVKVDYYLAFKNVR